MNRAIYIPYFSVSLSHQHRLLHLSETVFLYGRRKFFLQWTADFYLILPLSSLNRLFAPETFIYLFTGASIPSCHCVCNTNRTGAITHSKHVPSPPVRHRFCSNCLCSSTTFARLPLLLQTSIVFMTGNCIRHMYGLFVAFVLISMYVNQKKGRGFYSCHTWQWGGLGCCWNLCWINDDIDRGVNTTLDCSKNSEHQTNTSKIAPRGATCCHSSPIFCGVQTFRASHILVISSTTFTLIPLVSLDAHDLSTGIQHFD
jgi:hypothetical protein